MSVQAAPGGEPGARPSERGVFPHLRLGRWWINLLWVIPALALVVLAGFGVATWLRTLPEVQDFIARYPGSVVRDEPQGYPWWLRWQHLLNAIFLVPIVRAGLQVWAGRPRAYWCKPGTPGRDWLRIQRAMPAEGGWSMRDDVVDLHPQIGIPGGKRGGGLGRIIHLSVTMLWVANGILFYILLFATGQWTRTVPTSWDVFPNALSALIQYLSFHFPVTDSWSSYNSLQLLSYFATTFIAAPLAVLTGLAHSPAIAKRLKATDSRILNAEVAKSLHLLVLAWFVVFTIAHVTLVLITGALENLNHIVLGEQGTGWAGAILFAAAVVIGAILWFVASRFATKHQARVQKVGTAMLGPANKWF